jgi:hypothetical protein
MPESNIKFPPVRSLCVPTHYENGIIWELRLFLVSLGWRLATAKQAAHCRRYHTVLVSSTYFKQDILLPPSVIRVNRRACHLGPYKSPRRPHIPPRASRVRCHPSQVSGLTFAHPCSLNLARPHPPPPARPIESPYAGPENYGDTLVAMATALQ